MSNLKKYILLVLAVFAIDCQQRQEMEKLPVDAFFKAQDRTSYRISPDGLNLAYLKLENRNQNLYVEDIQTGKARKITNLKDRDIGFYFWVDQDELIYFKQTDPLKKLSDIFIVNKDGKDTRQLTSNERGQIKVLEDQLIDDQYILISSNKRDSTVFDVYRLNVRSGTMEMAAQNPGNITSWTTDAEGKLRLATSSDGINETLLYRESEQSSFKPVITNNFKTAFRPVAFAFGSPHVVYAISSINRDKSALVEFDCRTGKEIRQVFASDTLNITDAQYSRKKRKIAFVVYQTWKKEKHYLDDSVKALYQKLDKLLPGTETRIIDRDEAESVYIVRTFTDRNPGAYYLYFENANKLRKLSDFNPAIREAIMCDMKPVSFLARDGMKINGYLTLPSGGASQNLPVVVLPHDGPVRRDLWGYDPEVQFLANRGYAVFQINYRGSSGYGKEFMSAGFKEWGGKVQNDVTDGVNWLIDQKIADPRRVGIYGTGFGGYIALSAVCSEPELFTCAASNSGVINLFTFLKSIPPYLKPNLQMFYEVFGNPLTDVDKMRHTSPLFQTERINIPVFIAQDVKDPNNNTSETVQFVRNLQKRKVSVTYLENEGNVHHGKDDTNRQRYYHALEQFLEVNLKKK
ncbi:S9 family peptidase [Pedobacter deserti]|uniref:S9 family peptidase n=1 Tax=Pedobacter deserti TaxID=2817382 RepID=UPI00210A681E|nr:prolyl oligopeptidase family serine peptidase [Pedobacter sp. SYSU D00382]